MAALPVGDRLDLHELAARYGNVIDDRAWDRLAEVFTGDARYELAGFGRMDTVLDGVEAITTFMTASASHPVAHHVTNIEAWTDPLGTVRMRSLVAGTLTDGRVGSASYDDEVVNTAQGWRIASRVVTLLRPR